MTDDTQKLVSPVGDNKAGHVVIDNRGRNVWQWKDEQLDNTSIVLKRLENDALQLEPTRSVPIPENVAPGKETRRTAVKSPRDAGEVDFSEKLEYDTGRGGGGFDPYNRS